MSKIRVKHAAEHNLKSVDLEMPLDSLVVVTGVSGSGKSSLAFDTIYREGQRRYLSSLSSYARQYLGKIGAPNVEHIDGLMPAVAVDQKTVVQSPRSTVGTMSEIYDHLRLLFSRASDDRVVRSSSLFSFNSPSGACPACKGLGVEDKLSADLLVSDENKTLREGALVITTPTGYLVYSQVTLEVLNRVCEAHGFNVDIPWKDLTDEQLDVVLNGSDRIKIPFGKHPLESRLKWSGITAKPREEGYYKGILPVMEEILKRDRNKNILRFVRSLPCSACTGARLGPNALSVRFQNQNIEQMSAMSLGELHRFFEEIQLEGPRRTIAAPIVEQILSRTGLLLELGLDYLTCSRESTTLSGGEAQRLRLANQVASRLQGILYVLDEPSIGLHQRDNKRLIDLLRRLASNGNTVIVVEHDEETMRAADWLVDLGPGAGVRGGELLYSGPLDKVAGVRASSPTAAYLVGDACIPVPSKRRPGTGDVSVIGARQFNLQNVDAEFAVGALNVVTGVSGAGKTTLVERTLAASVRGALGMEGDEPGAHESIDGLEQFDKLIDIDQSPIGRTPRSNPATYTKLFDLIRDLFASEELSRERGYGKGTFSFNVKGGRCETCGGAGVVEVGMHFLENVDVPCEECDGKRFHDDTLEVFYRGLNIHEVLELTVEEAAEHFSDQPKIMRHLGALIDVGLGYITLGQPSTTLSGGEAQRVKLAAQLARKATGKTLYVLAEPTVGLHAQDIKVLLAALMKLVDGGNTAIAIEHNLDFIKCADRIIDLGPDSGAQGGRVIAQGTPERVAQIEESSTGRYLRAVLEGERPDVESAKQPAASGKSSCIELRGVTTHNLTGLDVDIPHQQLTVITGVSGSGKSSLAYDTIFAEGSRLFSQSLSSQARRYFKQMPTPPSESIVGMNAAIAIKQSKSADNPRSTAGTITEIYDLYRLLFSRVGVKNPSDAPLSARMFSFNHTAGACPSCKGLGVRTVGDPAKLVTHPQKTLLDGALDGTKSGRFYGERGGQHLAILQTVADSLGLDLQLPWSELDENARDVAMHGTGDRVWNAVWNFDRKGRTGQHVWDTPWLGFCGYVEEEYQRVHGDHRGEKMRGVMKDEPCGECRGARLKEAPRSVRLAGVTLPELVAKSVDETAVFLDEVSKHPGRFDLSDRDATVATEIISEVMTKLTPLQEVGLGYLSIDRWTSTLSGGELQRLLLAARLGGQLSSVTYVLDEPTAGLHGRDTQKLIGVLERLRDQGNTVVVVEHDEDVIRAADHILDLGPGAGLDGGRLVAVGELDAIEKCKESLTGQYLSGRVRVSPSRPERSLGDGLQVHGARANNLDELSVHVPAGGVVSVTGVSGSGKSSLVFDTIVRSFGAGMPVFCDELSGLERFDAVFGIDQSPIGSSPLSNPATYSGLFDRIRELFARSDDAVARGFKKSRFSFNSKGGRCEPCAGMGQIKMEMGFLADVWLPCEECVGRRYNEETLAVRFEGKNIFDVLEMTVDEAVSFFETDTKLSLSLEILSEVGLGYLTLGQPANTISGGESQRLKLASELIRAGKAGSKAVCNLYVFDEPTCGLHFADVSRLLTVFDKLVDAGHTVLVVEHNLDVIAASDWVIDLGPEGGDGGGRVVAQGTPTHVAACEESWTGRLLRGRPH